MDSTIIVPTSPSTSSTSTTTRSTVVPRSVHVIWGNRATYTDPGVPTAAPHLTLEEQREDRCCNRCGGTHIEYYGIPTYSDAPIKFHDVDCERSVRPAPGPILDVLIEMRKEGRRREVESWCHILIGFESRRPHHIIVLRATDPGIRLSALSTSLWASLKRTLTAQAGTGYSFRLFVEGFNYDITAPRRDVEVLLHLMELFGPHLVTLPLPADRFLTLLRGEKKISDDVALTL